MRGQVTIFKCCKCHKLYTANLSRVCTLCLRGIKTTTPRKLAILMQGCGREYSSSLYFPSDNYVPVPPAHRAENEARILAHQQRVEKEQQEIIERNKRWMRKK